MHLDKIYSHILICLGHLFETFIAEIKDLLKVQSHQVFSTLDSDSNASSALFLCGDSFHY